MAGHARYTALLDACVLFPVAVCDSLIQVIHPDEFLIAQMDLDPLIVLAAFKEQRARLKNPAHTPSAFADALERNASVLIAQRLREAAALI